MQYGPFTAQAVQLPSQIIYIFFHLVCYCLVPAVLCWCHPERLHPCYPRLGRYLLYPPRLQRQPDTNWQRHPPPEGQVWRAPGNLDSHVVILGPGVMTRDFRYYIFTLPFLFAKVFLPWCPLIYLFIFQMVAICFFLVAKLLYKYKCPSVCPSVFPSTTFRGKRDFLRRLLR